MGRVIIGMKLRRCWICDHSEAYLAAFGTQTSPQRRAQTDWMNLSHGLPGGNSHSRRITFCICYGLSEVGTLDLLGKNKTHSANTLVAVFFFPPPPLSLSTPKSEPSHNHITQRDNKRVSRQPATIVIGITNCNDSAVSANFDMHAFVFWRGAEGRGQKFRLHFASGIRSGRHCSPHRVQHAPHCQGGLRSKRQILCMCVCVCVSFTCARASIFGCGFSGGKMGDEAVGDPPDRLTDVMNLFL